MKIFDDVTLTWLALILGLMVVLLVAVPLILALMQSSACPLCSVFTNP